MQRRAPTAPRGWPVSTRKEHPLPALDIPLASHVLTGSILSLVIPLGVLIAITVWYVAIWQHSSREP